MPSPRRSAGILLHRSTAEGTEVLLGHLGGPLWTRRERSWGVPKGELEPGEDPVDGARREFAEELGLPVPAGEWVDLGEVRQSSGKWVQVWAVAADLDPETITPGLFEMEWPPKSGRRQQFPEVDRVAWFALPAARDVIIAGQLPFVDRLVEQS